MHFYDCTLEVTCHHFCHIHRPAPIQYGGHRTMDILGVDITGRPSWNLATPHLYRSNSEALPFTVKWILRVFWHIHKGIQQFIEWMKIDSYQLKRKQLGKWIIAFLWYDLVHGLVILHGLAISAFREGGQQKWERWLYIWAPRTIDNQTF